MNGSDYQSEVCEKKYNSCVLSDITSIAMQKIVFENLAEGQSINRWNVSEAAVERFTGVARCMPDDVNYRFVNGWVDTGDLPCREAWRAHVANRALILEDVQLTEVHCGFENPRVDFSCFCFQPVVVSRWARCKLTVVSQQKLLFRATTCGGMYLWSNQSLILVHEPYTRNSPEAVEFELMVRSGESEINVYFDDLHERDTRCFFQLQLIKGTDVRAGLLTSSDPQRLSEVERLMAGLRLDSIFYRGGELCITSDALPAERVELLLANDTLPVQNAASDGFNSRKNPRQIRVFLSKDNPSAQIFDSADLISGCPELIWHCTVGDITVKRKIGTSVLTDAVDLGLQTSRSRRRYYLKTLADHAPESPTYALVMLCQNRWNNNAQKNFERLIDIVDERDDCADFHIMPLIWIACCHADSLSVENQEKLRAALLGFRYWLDEPGNDVMWFWSENHVLCFHVAQYLAGGLFPEKVFTNSGKSGKAQAKQALARLHCWFDSIDQHGLAEWNSAAYYPIDLRGLLTLYSNAKDENIIQRAGILMDQIFQMMALHTINGVPAGSQGRAYEKELLAGPATELGAVAAVGFGLPWYRGHDTAASLLAISGYCVPPDLDEVLQVPVGLGLMANYYQGIDNNAELHLWKTADAQLSSVCNHASGTPGHQQHLLDLQFAGHPHARVWINHPGELQVWGEGRPSYWAGNGLLPTIAHHEDCVMMIYDLDDGTNEIAFTHLFCPADVMDEINVVHPGWLFCRSHRGYAAIFGSDTLVPLTTGLYAGSEWRLNKRNAAWIVIAGNEYEYESFDKFVMACLCRQARFCVDSKTLALVARNGLDTLVLSHLSQLQRNGKTVKNDELSNLPKTCSIPLKKKRP